MKTGRKILSFLLSAAVVLSCISVSFGALAAEADTKPTAVEALEEKLEEFLAINTNLAAAKPTITVDESDSKYESQKARVEAYEQALALYNEILPMYKALSDAEKDQIDVQNAVKFLQKGVNKEAYDIRTAYNADKPKEEQMSSNESMVKGQEQLFSLIGPHAARDEAMVAAAELWTSVGKRTVGTTEMDVLIGTSLDFSAYPAGVAVLERYIADYKAASPLARAYMDGVNPSTKTYGLSSFGGKLRDLTNMIVKKQMTADGLAFDGGDKPSEAQAAAEWTAAKYNWEADLLYDAFLSVTDGLSDLKGITDTVKLLREGYMNFIATNDIELAEKGIAAYEDLSAYEQKVVSTLTFKSFSFANQNSKGTWTTTQVTTAQLYAKCVDARNIVYVQEFEAWLATIDLSKVDNSVVAEALARFGEIPASVRSQISEEAQAIYQDVLSKYDPVKPLTPGAYDYALEIAAHNADLTRVTMPDSKYATEAGVDAAMAELDTLLYQLLGTQIEGLDAEQGLSATLFTNATVGKLLCLYDTLYNSEINVDAMGMTLNVGPILGAEGTPSKLAKLITDSETEFAAAKAKLATAPTDTTADYHTMTWENGDWGFQDGDKEGFKNAVACVLRPLAKVLDTGVLMISQILKLPNYNAENGDYCYGAYEELIPALESIGLDMPSSAQYTADYEAALAQSKEKSYSALLYPVIDAVVDLLDEFSAAPVETLVKYLPQVGYTIDSGILDESVKNTLNKSTILSGLTSSLDLSGDGINNMLTAEPLQIELSEGNTISIQLRDVNWYALSHCGTAYCADSVRADNIYRVGIEADKVKTFSVLYYYLYDILFTEPNLSSLKEGVKNESAVVGFVASPVLNSIAKMGKVDSYGLVLDTLNGDPSAGLRQDVSDTVSDAVENLPLFGGNDAEDTENTENAGGDGTGTSITDAPSVPKTAGAVRNIGAVFTLAVSAAVVGFAVRRRRDGDE
ncbi:MAG: hypothetical protein ACI4K6_00180 [Candidatus Fimenecus sp.]